MYAGGDTERVAIPTRPRPPLSRDPLVPSGGSGANRARPRLNHRSVWGELWRWSLTLIMFAGVLAILGGVSLVAAIYWQSRSDQTRPIDAIVVLGTAQYNGQPGPVFRARLDQTLAAYEAGNAPLVVVTGGRATGDQHSEAETAHAYLVERGVPSGAILLENNGRDSWQSMSGVAELLQARGLQRVLLVSDGFHLFRLKLMARDLGLEPYGSPATDSPIRRGGPTEMEYVVREAGAVVEHFISRR